MSSAGVSSPVAAAPGPVTARTLAGSRAPQLTWATVLLRHAYAVDKHAWTRPDDDRPLSDRGRAQAVALVDPLSRLSIGRVLSSPRLRCRQTVGPLAERLGVAVEDCALLDRDVDPAELARFLDGLAPPTAVLCTHGETLTALLAHWQAGRRVVLPVSPEGADGNTTEKSAAWIVERGAGGLRAHYLPPPRTTRVRPGGAARPAT